MSEQEQTRLLELAACTHQKAAPSEFEVRMAARRVLARLERPVQSPRLRGPLLAIALLCGAGAALAAALAGGGRAETPAAPPDRGPVTRGHVPGFAPGGHAGHERAADANPGDASPAGREQAPDTRSGQALGSASAIVSRARRQSAPPAPVSPHTAPSVVSAVSAARQGRSVPGKVAAQASDVSQQASASGWGEVARAMQAQDQERAERALVALARRPATRAKAYLGLAQLAAGRGDCVEARRLAELVSRSPAAAADLQRQARQLAERCRPQSR